MEVVVAVALELELGHVDAFEIVPRKIFDVFRLNLVELYIVNVEELYFPLLELEIMEELSLPRIEP